MVALSFSDLLKRQFSNTGSDNTDNNNCYYVYGSVECGNSAWANWVRWVVLVVIVLVFFILFALCSCYSARRRRRAGLWPYYGTGWTTNYHHGNFGQQWQQPAPPYSRDAPPAYVNDNGYFAPQTEGIELGAPERTYQGPSSGAVYQPPPGPPNKKGNTVIR